VNSRVSYLEGCFSQRNDRRATIRNFACGMFSEWELLTVVDTIQERLEEKPDNEEVSLDDMRDFLRYTTRGPMPVTRPLPVAMVSTSGELLPPHFMPLRGMTLWYFQYKDAHFHSVRAIRDYVGADDKDLSFHAGDIIIVSKTSNDGWWTGRLENDSTKQPEDLLFPANFVVTGK
jgi:hypothetical protein